MTTKALPTIASGSGGLSRYLEEIRRFPMLEPDEEFVRSHPVAALALLPAWFRPVEGERLEVLVRAQTDDYTVTSNPQMASQVVVGARGEAGGAPVRVHFRGFRSFALDFQPRAATGAGRAAP